MFLSLNNIICKKQPLVFLTRATAIAKKQQLVTVADKAVVASYRKKFSIKLEAAYSALLK